MEEIIKEAERLYKQIDEIQLNLLKSRLDVCEEKKWKDIYEMETAMCAVFQFLKCIVERKDNIVDLSQIWKDKSIPFEKTELVVASNYDRTAIVYADKDDILSEAWDGYKYAFVKDLLPKGGE